MHDDALPPMILLFPSRTSFLFPAEKIDFFFCSSKIMKLMKLPLISCQFNYLMFCTWNLENHIYKCRKYDKVERRQKKHTRNNARTQRCEIDCFHMNWIELIGLYTSWRWLIESNAFTNIQKTPSNVYMDEAS